MIQITTDFAGYPDGPIRHFRAGDKPADLAADYAALLIEKGLAVPVNEPAKPKPSKKEDAE